MKVTNSKGNAQIQRSRVTEENKKLTRAKWVKKEKRVEFEWPKVKEEEEEGEEEEEEEEEEEKEEDEEGEED